jgi:lysophospholipase L1-like esterase
MPELVPSEPTVRPLQSVVVVGDSLTVGTEIYGTTLTQSLFNAGVTKVFVSAENGRTTSEGITELERLPIDDGAVILALGTNDVAGGTPEIFGGLIDQAVAIIPKTIDIFWLNLYTDQWVSDDAYNAKINQKANIYSNLFVMDFETFASPNWLEGDGVHLSPEGYIERTEFILTELGLK